MLGNRVRKSTLALVCLLSLGGVFQPVSATPSDSVDGIVDSVDGSGHCTVTANGPYSSGLTLWGSGTFYCGHSHTSMTVRVCIQSYKYGEWSEVACDASTGLSSNSAGTASPSFYDQYGMLCGQDVSVRIKSVGKAFNASGNLVHHKTTKSGSIRWNCP